MRATCAVIIAALVLGQTPIVRAAEPSSESAEQLYEDGRKAYRLGRYADAVKKFERSYELSDQPLLLYNIALSYKRLYGISKDVGDLRRSKTVFEEFINVASADSSLSTEVEDARARLAEIDEEIKRAEEADAARQAQIAKTPVDADAGPTSRDRKLRVGGVAAMAAGGGLVVGGVAMGTYYAIRAEAYRGDIKEEKDALPTECYPEKPPASCPNNRVDRLAAHRKNLDEAKLGMGLGFGLMAGLGAVAIITGAVLFAKGRKKGGSARAVKISPTFTGVVVSAKF